MKKMRLITKLFLVICITITILPITTGSTDTLQIDCILVHNSQCRSCEERFNTQVISFYEKYQFDNRISFKMYDIADLDEQNSFLYEMERLNIDLSLYNDLPYVIFIWETNSQVLDASSLALIEGKFHYILVDDNISPHPPKDNSISLLEFLPSFNYPILYLSIIIVLAGVFLVHKGYAQYLKHGGGYIYPRRISLIRFWTIITLSSLSIALLIYQFLERFIGGCGCASGNLMETLLFQKYDHIIILSTEIPIAIIGILFNLAVILQIILLGGIRFHQKSRNKMKIFYFFLIGQLFLGLLSLIYLVYLELFVIHFICTLCTISQFIICINTLLIVSWHPWKFNIKNLYTSTKREIKLPVIDSNAKQKLIQSFSLLILIFIVFSSIAPIGILTRPTTPITVWNIPDSPLELNSNMCIECNNPMDVDTQGPISLHSENPIYSQINEILAIKPVFLFFYAEWCGFCKKQKPILLELSEEYSDKIEFLYINAEEHPQMRQDFGVTGFPTMFLINKNEERYSYRIFRGFNEKSSLSDYFDMGYISLPVDKAKQIIDRNKNVIILDVRPPSEFELIHINNSMLVPLTELKTKMEEMNEEDFIIVYCESGRRSQEASIQLKENGFLYVHNIAGGIEAWIDAEYPVEPEIESSVSFSTQAETCSSNIDCGMGQYCAKDPGDCEGTGICELQPVICPDVYDPVCGCDGITY
ncbi:MAG: rhodanese-like domain-containing protein, partial [Promethearchaeota archaeon]